MNEPLERKIIHIDMDAFFASVEQRDNPGLKGKPLVVGFDGPRGVVSAASYEARRFGIHSAMSMIRAKQQCPGLTVVACRHDYYKKISTSIHEIFNRYTDLIEPLSIDEAFLDVTSCKTGDTDSVAIAKKIRAEIMAELGLTASAGVSYNKFLAKIASDYNKPNGLCCIKKDDAADFLSTLPITDFWGVGPKTATVMHRMGIFCGSQLLECSLSHLVEVFGKSGRIYYDFARGVDDRAVEPYRERKSVGCEQTFAEDINRKSIIFIELYHIVVELSERLAASKFKGFTLTLKIKFDDFTQTTKSLTINEVLDTKERILPLARQLMSQSLIITKPIRLIGLSVSNPETGRVKGKWTEGFLDFGKGKIIT